MAVEPAELGSVLLVEDDSALRFAMRGSLRRRGLDVLEAATCEAATRSFAAERPDVVLVDLRLPDGDGLQLLSRLRSLDPSVVVFIVTGHGTIALAVQAVKEGAADFLTKPVDMDLLYRYVHAALERRRGTQSGIRKTQSRPLGTTRSPAIERMEEQLARLRGSDCSVLLLGETGTGKSMLARRIHATGSRSGGPFVELNCAGLGRDLFESEVFGHERGAFTGAHGAKEGLIEAANGGTFFLDEIGDVDPQVQPKLLKVLEEKRFRRLGGVREQSVDIRLVAATHHDLFDSVSKKQFRADLYYRISAVTLTIPPLRERQEDVLSIAQETLRSLGSSVEIAASAKAVLLEHTWPGNIRELKNVLQRAVLLRSSGELEADDIRFDVPSSGSFRVAKVSSSLGHERGHESDSSIPTKQTLAQVERAHIESALAAENGRVSAAARRLGIPRSTLYLRLREYGLTPVRSRHLGPTSPDED